MTRDLMKSSEIDVSYFAAGIFAHLCCDGIQWNRSSVDLTEVLNELVSEDPFLMTITSYIILR